MRDVAVFVDLDADHVARLGEVGDGADRPLVGFERVDPDLRRRGAAARRASAAGETR